MNRFLTFVFLVVAAPCIAHCDSRPFYSYSTGVSSGCIGNDSRVVGLDDTAGSRQLATFYHEYAPPAGEGKQLHGVPPSPSVFPAVGEREWVPVSTACETQISGGSYLAVGIVHDGVRQLAFSYSSNGGWTNLNDTNLGTPQDSFADSASDARAIAS